MFREEVTTTRREGARIAGLLRFFKIGGSMEQKRKERFTFEGASRAVRKSGK